MENRNSVTSVPVSMYGDDVTTWALPEGAIARLGRGSERDMAFSPDGQYFAVGSAIGLWLYELPTLSPIGLWDTERGMTDAVTFSPDSLRIVTYTFVENMKIWDIERGICIAEAGNHGSSDISKPVFSPDGQRIVATNYQMRNGKVFSWDSENGSLADITEINRMGDIRFPTFSPDVSLLAATYYDRDSYIDNSIAVWHVETGEQIADIPECPKRVQGLCFSKCGHFLAIGSSSGTIRVWDMESGQLVTTYANYGDAQIFPHYSPEEGLITAAVSERQIEVWNVGQYEKLDEFQHRGNSRRACFSESGKQLAVASKSEIQIWTKGNNSDTHTLSTLHGHIPTMDTLVFSSDEKTLAAGLWGDNVLLWDVASRRSYRPRGEKLPGTSQNVYRSPSGKIVSINHYGVNLKVQEVGKSEPIVELIASDARLGRAKAFSPTGHRIASVDQDDNIHIWERTLPLNGVWKNENWKKNITVINDAEFINRLRFSLNGLAFSPDGRRLASISQARDCKACLWDADSGKQIIELPLKPPSDQISYHRAGTGIAFSPCGDTIAGGRWGEIVFWDATDGKTLMTLPQPEGSQRPFTLCFSPCGEYLASGAWWQSGLQKVPIRLWEVASGKNIATFWGHTTDVQCFAFSSDSTVLASSGHDGSILLWDLTAYL